MGSIFGLMGKQYKNVYPKNNNIIMKSIDGSIKTIFLPLTIFVAGKMILDTVFSMINSNKKR